MTQSERDQLLEDALATPAATAIDGTSVTNRPLGELADAIDRASAASAAAKPHRGIRFTKLRPPGATG